MTNANTKSLVHAALGYKGTHLDAPLCGTPIPYVTSDAYDSFGEPPGPPAHTLYPDRKRFASELGDVTCRPCHALLSRSKAVELGRARAELARLEMGGAFQHEAPRTWRPVRSDLIALAKELGTSLSDLGGGIVNGPELARAFTEAFVYRAIALAETYSSRVEGPVPEEVLVRLRLAPDLESADTSMKTLDDGFARVFTSRSSGRYAEICATGEVFPLRA